MLIALQFPISDLRSLLVDSSPPFIPLSNPRTLSGEGIADSLPYFGWAADRPRGADHTFPDEGKFYSVHNALYLLHLGKKRFAAAGVDVHWKISSKRRLFIPKQGLPVRIEVEIGGVRARQLPMGFETLIKLLKSVLLLPSKVQNIENLPANLLSLCEDNVSDIGPLVLQGKALASHFALATSRWNPEDYLRTTRLIRTCQPILVAEFERGEFSASEVADKLSIFRRLDREKTGGADIWYGQISSGHRNRIPCWLIASRGTKRDNLRSLRICLLRLHAEHRVLDEVLRWHERAVEPSLDSEKLSRYIRSVWNSVLDRTTRAGLDQSALMDAISVAAAVRPEAQSILLKDRVLDLMRELDQKPLRHEASVKPSLSWQTWLKQVQPPPDLTVVLHSQPDSSVVQWNFSSPHLALPGLSPLMEPGTSNLGKNPEDFANELMDFAANNQSGLQNEIHGKGLTIGAAIPRAFWTLIELLNERLKRPPTLLLLSQDPYVPWELARDPDNKDSGFLGSRSVIGRWLLQTPETHPHHPPATLDIKSAMLMAGRYKTGNLTAASEEIDEIKGALAGTAVKPIDENADRETVRNYFNQTPMENLLHFALHGKYAPSSTEDGLQLNDGHLNFWQVKVFNLKMGKPLVFLNACEAGAARKVLNSVEGMAEAFINAGASAVIAPIWAIDDNMACTVAKNFYTQALGIKGTKPAEFFRGLREGFDKNEKSYSSLTLLAYKFYGHPNLELKIQ